MKKEKGFISISLIYSFFLVFLLIMLSIILSYTNKKFLSNIYAIVPIARDSLCYRGEDLLKCLKKMEDNGVFKNTYFISYDKAVIDDANYQISEICWTYNDFNDLKWHFEIPENTTDYCVDYMENGRPPGSIHSPYIVGKCENVPFEYCSLPKNQDNTYLGCKNPKKCIKGEKLSTCINRVDTSYNDNVFYNVYFVKYDDFVNKLNGDSENYNSITKYKTKSKIENGKNQNDTETFNALFIDSKNKYAGIKAKNGETEITITGDYCVDYLNNGYEQGSYNNPFIYGKCKTDDGKLPDNYCDYKNSKEALGGVCQ